MVTAEGVFPKKGGDPPYASEYNKMNLAQIGSFFVKRTASNSDYDDANDIMVMLSKTRYIAFDDSAKDILLTTNSGDTWNIINSDTTDTLDQYYVNPHDANYITFFSGVFNETAWYSEDGGGSWTQITPQADADQDTVAYSITTNGRLYVAQSDGGTGEIHYSDNGGTAWTPVTGHQAFRPETRAIIASPKDDIIAYAIDENAAGTSGGYTLDGGSAWVEQTQGAQASPGIYTCVYIDSDNYLIDLADTVNTGVGGTHIVHWNAVTLSSSATESWHYDSTFKRYLLKFDSTEMITTSTSTTGSVSNKFLADGTIYAIPGTISQGSWIDGTNFLPLKYHGLSYTAGEIRLHNGTISSSAEQLELWGINEI